MAYAVGSAFNAEFDFPEDETPSMSPAALPLRNPFGRIAAILLVAASVLLGGLPVAAQSPEDGNEKIGDGILKCRSAAADGPEACVLVQDIIFRQSGKRVLNLSIVRSGAKQPYIVAVTAPLGILLPAGLTLVIDGKELVRFPLRFCNVNGCQGSFPFASDVKGWFFGSEKGQVMFRQPNGRPLRVNFSLKGFDRAFAAFDAKIKGGN